MMKNNKPIWVFLSIILFCSACAEVFEPDLTSQHQTLLNPRNNQVITDSSLSFYWDSIPGASIYEIQIVRPSFDSLINFKVDSTVQNTIFNLSLPPGQYQWHVRAVNSSSTTSFSEAWKFTIQ